MPNYLTLTWDQFSNDTQQLSEQLVALDKKWTTIVAVARGGLVPATILSHTLAIHSIETVCINSYNDTTFEQQVLSVLKEYKSNSAQILVIDDLVDSGETFKIIRQMLPNAHYACVYAKPAGIKTTDSYYREVPGNTWLVFPWEEQL